MSYLGRPQPARARASFSPRLVCDRRWSAECLPSTEYNLHVALTISSRRVLLHEHDRLVIKPARIHVHGDLIERVDTRLHAGPVRPTRPTPARRPATTAAHVDLGDHLITPAFVNAHTHLALAFLARRADHGRAQQLGRRPVFWLRVATCARGHAGLLAHGCVRVAALGRGLRLGPLLRRHRGGRRAGRHRSGRGRRADAARPGRTRSRRHGASARRHPAGRRERALSPGRHLRGARSACDRHRQSGAVPAGGEPGRSNTSCQSTCTSPRATTSWCAWSRARVAPRWRCSRARACSRARPRSCWRTDCSRRRRTSTRSSPIVTPSSTVPARRCSSPFRPRSRPWSELGLSWVVATDCAASNDSMNLQKELRLCAGAADVRTDQRARLRDLPRQRRRQPRARDLARAHRARRRLGQGGHQRAPARARVSAARQAAPRVVCGSIERGALANLVGLEHRPSRVLARSRPAARARHVGHDAGASRHVGGRQMDRPGRPAGRQRGRQRRLSRRRGAKQTSASKPCCVRRLQACTQNEKARVDGSTRALSFALHRRC